MRLSIIIPILNETGAIAAQLAPLRACAVNPGADPQALQYGYRP